MATTRFAGTINVGGFSVSFDESEADLTIVYGPAFTIPDSKIDQELPLAADVSEVKYCIILATQDMTLETNDGATPDETLALKANKAYIYRKFTGEYDSFKFSTDINKVFISNASGSSGTIEYLVAQRPA